MQSLTEPQWNFIPSELVHEFAMYMSYEDIIHLCATGWSDICNDKSFWREKLEYEIEKYVNYLEWMDNNSVDVGFVEGITLTRKQISDGIKEMKVSGAPHITIADQQITWQQLLTARREMIKKGSGDTVTINSETITRLEAQNNSTPSQFLFNTALKKRQWKFIDILIFEYSLFYYTEEYKSSAILLDEKYFNHIWKTLGDLKKFSVTSLFKIALVDNNIFRLNFMINDEDWPELYSLPPILTIPFTYPVEAKVLDVLYEATDADSLSIRDIHFIAMTMVKEFNADNQPYNTWLISLWPYILIAVRELTDIPENIPVVTKIVEYAILNIDKIYENEAGEMRSFLQLPLIKNNRYSLLQLPLSEEIKEIMRNKWTSI